MSYNDVPPWCANSGIAVRSTPKASTLAFIDHLQLFLKEQQDQSFDKINLILLRPGIELGTRR
jgi:hypothetical protein